MKRILFALLCILGVSMGQAVTTSWTWDSERDGATITGTRGDSSNPLTGTYENFSLVASFTLSSDVLASGGTLFEMSGAGLQDETQRPALYETQRLALYVKDGALWLKFVGKNGVDLSEKNNMKVSEGLKAGEAYTFAFTRGTNGSNQMKFSLDGASAQSFYPTFSYNWAGEMTSLTLDGNSMTDFTIYKGKMTDEELSQYSVPEPTALALLALGVAGLALRRRVA